MGWGDRLGPAVMWLERVSCFFFSFTRHIVFPCARFRPPAGRHHDHMMTSHRTVTADTDRVTVRNSYDSRMSNVGTESEPVCPGREPPLSICRFVPAP